jgi:hypothetical protein
MRVNVAIPEEHVTAPVLNAALEATTRLNEVMLDKGKLPLFRDAKDAVRWKPEPPGDEHFDHGAMVLKRGWGDCDDLAPWHAASLRATGQDRGAQAVVKQVAPKRWHAVVQRSDGRIEDPSRAAGMPGQGSAQISGGVLPHLPGTSAVVGTYYENRPRLAVRPVFDRDGQHESWESRTDLPWHWLPGKTPTDIAMVSLHRAPTASQAVVGSIRGAVRLGEVQDDLHADTQLQLEALSDAVNGVPYEEMLDRYGEVLAGKSCMLVGSLFGSIAHIASNVVKTVGKTAVKAGTAISKSPIAMGVIAAIPGVGTGVAATLAAAHMGMVLKDALGKGKHAAITPEKALDAHLKGQPLHFIDPKTKQELKVNPPSPDKPPLRPTLDPQWTNRNPLHPSALPQSFTMHCTPIPG